LCQKKYQPRGKKNLGGVSPNQGNLVHELEEDTKKRATNVNKGGHLSNEKKGKAAADDRKKPRAG